MAVTVFVRPGQDNGAGQPDVNLLKVFSGEVLTAFEEANVMMGITRTKTVTGGAVSWQFPALGRATTSYHEPGENILLDADASAANYLKSINTSARTIFADRNLVSPIFLDNLDEVLLHWDARQEYATELGRAIATTVDNNLLRVVYNAAKASATVTGLPAGTTIVDADGDSNAASFIDSLFLAKVQMDLNSVPKTDRFCILSPSQMRLLFTTGAGAIQSGLQWINTDFSSGSITSNFAAGKVPMLAGFVLIESIHLDTTVGVKGTTNNKYSTSSTNAYNYTVGAGANIIALLFHKSAVGTVKLDDLTVETEYLIEYQGDVLVAKMNLGHGILRPEAAILMAKA